MVEKADVMRSLEAVEDPSGRGSIVDCRRVATVVIDKGEVGVVLDFKDTPPADRAAMTEQAESAVKALDGVSAVNVVMTALRQTGEKDKAAPPPPKSGPGNTPPPKPSALPGVQSIIAVASGKGGVGKSTTSVNLALALRDQGLKVGLLDADIFGPSLPMLMGIDQKPEAIDNRLQPIEKAGIKTMSIGFLLDVDQPVVWRGPRVMGATQQLLKDVDWGPLDVLVVDMPPGTGDVQLTMVQQVPLTGAVIVSTPQDLALIDARKGMGMFHKVDVPILGLVENMSTFICPECGTESAIFGHGGAEDAARVAGVPFLGAVPLAMPIREQSDKGTPVVDSLPDSPHARAYHAIARGVAAHLPLAEHS
ncbi:Mrp/NBP35 family ATP-binding protein [Yunchengibacter salinarum]|uniref:Mrp/NBP35 family ATP-binding protein n=1 Tax=Yunchengibacter salinarum TaxID=3133399 RepID=UPI0035B6570F